MAIQIAAAVFIHMLLPLHQAVSSGSLESVKLLVEAGASLSAKDKIYDGTPIDWAGYMQRDADIDETASRKYAIIAEYTPG